MWQISQPLKTRHLCRCLYHRQRPSHNFPSSSATKLAACGHFRDRSPFLPFLPAPDTKRDGNVRKKTWWTLFTQSPVLDMPVCPSTQELGRGVGLAASYTREHPQIPNPLSCPRVSGSPQTGTDSVRTHLVSLIHNSQTRCTERDRTASQIPVKLAPLQI